MATLYLICGMAGAGKTTLSRRLENTLGVVRFCPEEWIATLLTDHTDHTDHTDRAEMDRLRVHVEGLQWDTAQHCLRRGISVLLENGFWSRAERLEYRSVAAALGARVVLHFLDVPEAELLRRIRTRNARLPAGSFRVAEEELIAWLNDFVPPDADELQLYDGFEVHRPA